MFDEEWCNSKKKDTENRNYKSIQEEYDILSKGGIHNLTGFNYELKEPFYEVKTKSMYEQYENKILQDMYTNAMQEKVELKNKYNLSLQELKKIYKENEILKEEIDKLNLYIKHGC